MSDLPEGQLSRAAIVGTTALKLGLGQLHGKAKKTLAGDDSNDIQEALDEKTAKQLFEALVKLRGTAIKLAQMLGLETGLLPEKMRQELAKSWHQVPPLNRVLVRKVLGEEFDKTPNELFSEFSSEAFAAASLGQVHRAVLSGAGDVAVKIQYPGIHVTIESDIKLLRKIALGLPNRKIASMSIDEIHARLREELDYEMEASRTQWFRQNLKTEGVEVPEVFSERSTARVLTTRLLEGSHIDEWLLSKPSQEIRNRAAQRLYDCFVHSVRELNCVHADPNPGNYLFRDDGSIGLVDFGCTRELSTEFAAKLPELLHAYCSGRKEDLFDVYATIGMRFDDACVDNYEEIIVPFGEWVSKPFLEDEFDFGKNGDYTSSGRQAIQNLSKMDGLERIAEEFIYFDRTVYGLCKIFERLQATVRMRDRWSLT